MNKPVSIYRSFFSYLTYFGGNFRDSHTDGPLFEDFVRVSKKKGRWIDVGDDLGRAGWNYLYQEAPDTDLVGSSESEIFDSEALARLFQRIGRDRASVTTVSYSLKAGARTTKPGFRHLHGRLFEDVPNPVLGKADLITDIFGSLCYSDRIDDVLRKYLELLEPDGVIYAWLGSTSQLTTIRRKNGGAPMTLWQWITSIPGVEARFIDSKNEDTAVMGLRITKKSQNVEVPKLRLIAATAGATPVREFVEQ